MTDPNWLFSTVAQSAAALVAIVAGFIISRLLAISADKNGLEARLRDVRVHLASKNRDLQSASEQLLSRDAYDFIEDILDQLVKSEGNLPIAQAMNQANICNRTEQELKPYWENATATTKKALEFFRHNPVKWSGISELQRFLKDKGLDLSYNDLLIYERTLIHFESKTRKRNYTEPSPYTLPVFVPSPPVYESRREHEIESYKSMQKDIQSIERDVYTLKSQEADLESRISNIGKPEGIIFGFVTLIYFSLVGIVVPLLLLPTAINDFKQSYKWIVFSLFVSGLLLFFFYLFRMIRILSK